MGMQWDGELRLFLLLVGQVARPPLGMGSDPADTQPRPPRVRAPGVGWAPGESSPHILHV